MQLLHGTIRRRPDRAHGRFHLGLVHYFKAGTNRPSGLSVRLGDTTYYAVIVG